MKCLIILAVLFYFANAKSIGSVPEVMENPCTLDKLYVLRYYQPYSLDETKYIECNPWGFYEIKSCETGFKWNSWLMSCVRISTESMPVPVPNVDMGIGKVDIVSSEPIVMSNVTQCGYFGNNTCLNGGICNIFLDGFSKCFCTSNYTGLFCEIESPLSKGTFGEFINATFSLETYKVQRPFSNDSSDFNMTIDTSIKWDEVTKQKISEYLSLFPNGTLRFDMLVNYLVEDFISQLYPSSFYLQEFNYPTELQTGLSGAIPNLLLSSKYAFDNFEKFMVLYEDILDNLVDYLAENDKLISKEAQLFYEVYDKIFERMEEGKPEVVENRTDLTREDMIANIYDDYNKTMCKAYELFKIANKFDDELALKAENYTTEEVVYAIGNFSLSPEVVKKMTQIHTHNANIWDSLSFYGFWYVLSAYVVVPETMNSTVRQPFSLNSTVPRSLLETTVKPVIKRTSGQVEPSDEVYPLQEITTEEEEERVEKDLLFTTLGPRSIELETRVPKDLELTTPRVEKDIPVTVGVRDVEFTTVRVEKDIPVTTVFPVKRDLSTMGPRSIELETRVPKDLKLTTPRVEKDIPVTVGVRDVEFTTVRVEKDIPVTTVFPLKREMTVQPITRSLRSLDYYYH